MSGALLNVDRVALWALGLGVAFTAAMAVVVIAGRLGVIAHERFLRRLRREYGPLIEGALCGDETRARLREIGEAYDWSAISGAPISPRARQRFSKNTAAQIEPS